MKILVTGYTGFIGSHLVKRLAYNCVYGLDIQHNDSVSRHFNWEALNQIDEIDCIVHLAGISHDTQNLKSKQEYFKINLGLTQKIFDMFLASTATKFVYFSSVKAVTDNVVGEHLTEESTCNPETIYGQSKLAAEHYILGKTTSSDKKTYILRPCMIHGPGNKGNLNLLYKLVEKGLPWPLGAFNNKRTFCSIDNLLYVVQQLIERNIEPGIYQIADDEAISTNNLIALIASSQDRQAKIWKISPKLIKVLASAGDYFHLPLNRERLSKLTESYVVSNQKIKKALGVNKMPVSAVIGLQKTLESLV